MSKKVADKGTLGMTKPILVVTSRYTYYVNVIPEELCPASVYGLR